MEALFSPNSKFMKAMSRLGDLLLLNVYFLFSCIPIITIGAACTALYTVCFRFDTAREESVTKSYFRAFRENLKQGTSLWLILALCAVSAIVNTYLFYDFPSPLRYGFILFALLFVLALLIGAYAFPLLSQFSNDTKSTLKNALILSLGYLPRSVLITAANIFPFALMLLNFYAFLQAGFIWIALYFSAAAYMNTFLLKKVFAPYMTELEEEIQ